MSIMHTRQDDMRLLNMLHLHDNEGLTFQDISERYAVSRSSVAGQYARIRRQADQHPCKCRRKANKDGGMSPLWWRQ